MNYGRAALMGKCGGHEITINPCQSLLFSVQLVSRIVFESQFIHVLYRAFPYGIDIQANEIRPLRHVCRSILGPLQKV